MVEAHQSFMALCDVADGSIEETGPFFPFKRILICAECSRFFSGAFTRGRHRRYGYYFCYNRACPAYGKSIPREKVEAVIIERVGRYAFDESYLDYLRSKLGLDLHTKSATRENEKLAVERELAELEAKRRRIFEMREDGSYSREEFFSRKTVIEREMEMLALKQAEHKACLADFEAVFSYAKEFVRRFGDKWERMTPYIRGVFGKVILPDGIGWHRKEGVRTLTIGRIFGLYGEFCGRKSALVSIYNAIRTYFIKNSG